METKTRIESMVELRAFAIEKALTLAAHTPMQVPETVVRCAKVFEDYIKGNAELPETKQSSDESFYEYLKKAVKDSEEQRIREQEAFGKMLFQQVEMFQNEHNS